MADIDFDSEDSWRYASRYAELLFPLPERLLFAIRVLKRNDTENRIRGIRSIHSSSYAATRMIDRLRSFKIPIYFAASELFPGRFELAEDDTSKALLRVLGPDVFAVLLALVWFYRRIGKLCRVDVCEELKNDFLKDMEIGFLVGELLPELGPADGMLLGAVRHAAAATLMLQDVDNYRRYRNVHKGGFDIEFEHSRWGCDHTQISVYMLRRIGLAQRTLYPDAERPEPLAVRKSLLARQQRGSSADEMLNAWAACLLVIDRLKGQAIELSRFNEVYFQLGQDVLNEFVQRVRQIDQRGPSFQWMNKGYTSIEPSEDEPSARRRAVRRRSVDVPGFSEEDLEGLTAEEIEELRGYWAEYRED